LFLQQALALELDNLRLIFREVEQTGETGAVMAWYIFDSELAKLISFLFRVSSRFITWWTIQIIYYGIARINSDLLFCSFFDDERGQGFFRPAAQCCVVAGQCLYHPGVGNCEHFVTKRKKRKKIRKCKTRKPACMI